jgi:hypothetical protein
VLPEGEDPRTVAAAARWRMRSRMDMNLIAVNR